MGNKTPLVMHVIHTLGTGGMENGLVNILNRMPEDRYRHVIVCLSHATSFSDRLNSNSIEVVELNKKEGNDLLIYWKLMVLFWQYKPNIVHSRNLAALDVHLLKIFAPFFKSVHGEHGRDIYDLEGKNRKYNLLRGVLKYFVNQYIAVSKDLESWLIETIKVPPLRVNQIYNGVDHQLFSNMGSNQITTLEGLGHLPARADRFVIGTVGRLAAVKDQKTLIKAFATLLKQVATADKTLYLCIVGDGPLQENLTSLIHTLNIENNVIMLGDRKDVAAILPEMDIFVLSSLAEGISNTLLEAMACELTVVATLTGGNPELITNNENGDLFSVGDADALAGILSDLYVNEEKRLRMAQASLQRVREQFDWDKTVAAYMKVYDSLV